MQTECTVQKCYLEVNLQCILTNKHTLKQAFIPLCSYRHFGEINFQSSQKRHRNLCFFSLETILAAGQSPNVNNYKALFRVNMHLNTNNV